MAKPRIFGLTPNQQIFVDEWLIDRNSTRAYKIAYPKIKKDATAAASATRLLKNVKVQAYIAKGLEKMETRSENDEDHFCDSWRKSERHRLPEIYRNNRTGGFYTGGEERDI